MRNRGIMLCLLLCLLLPAWRAPVWASSDLPGSTAPPQTPVKLVFIHEITGGRWLADPNQGQPYGGLGRALMENNYFVSATNYGWGPGAVGGRTDILDWPQWFLGPDRETVLDDLYSENGQHVGNFGDWSRLGRDPGGENRIIVFGSGFANSNLGGQPDDPPLDEPNPTDRSVANAKAIYRALLTYFRIRPDKLFVVVTAPPLAPDRTTDESAANARAFNTWLVKEWLLDYPYANVVVFDYYNVLTGVDNHHRWNGREIEHVQGTLSNVAAYAGEDSHPSTEGHVKATAEFLPLLNAAYNRWQAGESALPSVNDTGAAGALKDVVDDFESDLAWHAYAQGARVTCAPSPDAHAGAGALRLAYSIPAEGQGGCRRQFDAPQDWSALRGLSFWLRGSRSGQRVTLMLFAGSPEAPVPYEAGFEVTADWQQVAFGWNDFTPPPGVSTVSRPSLDAARVTGLAFSLAAGEGTLDVDDLALFDGSVLSASPEVVVHSIPITGAPSETPAQIPPAVVEAAVSSPRQLAMVYALIPLVLLAAILGLVALRRSRRPPH